MRNYEDATDSQIDELFELLSSRRRRHVLKAVVEAENGVSLGRLAELSAAAETEGVDADDVKGQERKRVYISLRQTHIDALEAADVVKWDRETNIVSEGPEAKRLSRALSCFYRGCGDEAGEATGRVWERFRQALHADG